jgi:chromate reductase, NAD(P)H dehydrogenase (quinone)
MKILGISGSLRKASFNGGLLRFGRSALATGHTLDIADIGDLPLLNEDLEEDGLPPAVIRFRKEIDAADALLIASTEYNYGISGVLKNAIDWASRPYPQAMPSEGEAPGDGGIYTIPSSPLTGKPVGIMGASAGIGGTIRSQLQLRQSLQVNSALVLPQPEVFVTFGYSGKFDLETGDLLDEQTKAYVRALMEALLAWAPVAHLPIIASSLVPERP